MPISGKEEEAKRQEWEESSRSVPSVRRVLIPLAFCGLSVVLFPTLLLFTGPAVQFQLLVVTSSSMGVVIGTLVRPPRLACVMGVCALGAGAFFGILIAMAALPVKFGDPADWWRAAMAVSVIAGLLHGILAGATAGIVSLALISRRGQAAETQAA